MEINCVDVFNNSPISQEKARELSPQALAFVGDAVHTLFVRTKVLDKLDAKSNALHKATASYVKATAQSEKIDMLMTVFTEEELYFYKRGRNVKTYSTAKNATVGEYRRATGFEAVLGYLFLTANYERLDVILNASYEGENNTCQK